MEKGTASPVCILMWNNDNAINLLNTFIYRLTKINVDEKKEILFLSFPSIYLLPALISLVRFEYINRKAI